MCSEGCLDECSLSLSLRGESFSHSLIQIAGCFSSASEYSREYRALTVPELRQQTFDVNYVEFLEQIVERNTLEQQHTDEGIADFRVPLVHEQIAGLVKVISMNDALDGL